MNKMKTKLKISRRSVQYALFNPSNRILFGGILGIGVVTALLVHFDLYIFAGILAVLGVASFAALVWTSLVEYSAAEAHNKLAMLNNWVQAGGSPEERAQRWSLLQLNSLDDAWEHSNLDYSGPRYNIDGTMMLPGDSRLDFNGQMYGASDISFASYNPGTSSWADPTSAYSNPLSSDMGYTGLSDMDSSSTDSMRHD